MTETAWGERKDPTFDEMYQQIGDLGDAKHFFYDWGGLNKWLFKTINGIRNDSYDNVMVLISKMADHKNFLYFMAMLSIFVVCAILIRKLRGKGSIRPRLVMWLGIYLVLIVGYGVNGMVVRTIKDYMEFPRPFVELAKENVHQLEFRDSDDNHRSFPSGHVAYITFLIIALWPAFSHDWRWYMLLIVPTVGWSRISLGMHYPADVVGGFLIASITIIIVRAVIYTILRKLFNIVC